MNNILNWFTQKRFTIISFSGVCLYVLSYFHKFLGLPEVYKNFCCADDRRLNFFLVFVLIFIFAVIFANLTEIKFAKWRKFTILCIALYVILYFLSPTQGDGFLWLQRETISFFGAIFYLIFSLGLLLFVRPQK